MPNSFGSSGSVEEDINMCSVPSIPRTVALDELIRLLRVFRDHPNVR